MTSRPQFLAGVHHGSRVYTPLMDGPKGQVCPRCNAQPGHRCISAHKAIATPIAKFHQERRDLVPKQRDGE